MMAIVQRTMDAVESVCVSTRNANAPAAYDIADSSAPKAPSVMRLDAEGRSMAMTLSSPMMMTTQLPTPTRSLRIGPDSAVTISGAARKMA